MPCLITYKLHNSPRYFSFSIHKIYYHNYLSNKAKSDGYPQHIISDDIFYVNSICLVYDPVEMCIIKQ
jgi:hypothetical protein